MDWQLLRQTAITASRSTCQFYIYDNERFGIPRPHGCGVLVHINNKYYCISNAHVIGDEYLGKTFIFTSKNNQNHKRKTTTIGGHYRFTQMPVSGKREDDTLDIAVVLLNNDCKEDLLERGHSFLEIDCIESNYKPKESDKLLISGYPSTVTKVNTHFKSVVAKPLYLLTKPHIDDLAAYNFPKDLHTYAKYSIGQIYNPQKGIIQKGPAPYGLSGSGLWHIFESENGIQKALLTGILTTYLQKRNLVVSTNIGLFVDLIRQQFDPTIYLSGVGVGILS